MNKPSSTASASKKCSHDDTQTDGIEAECESESEDEHESEGQARPSSTAHDLLWLVFLSAVLGSLLTTPHWLWTLDHWNDPTTPVPVGTVQRVLFIGNLGIDSQIDTEVQSFMVHGVTQFKRGTRLAQHKTLGGLLLCDVDTPHCEDRMGVP
jgi:hypothetical protein